LCGIVTRHRSNHDVTGRATRRAFLATTGAVTLGGVAGCLGAGSNTDTHLAPPDSPADPEDLAYPAYGQPVPDVSVPAPLHDTTVSPADRDSTLLLTFFFSYCESVCPRLISTLRNVQAEASENGYGDQIDFLPVSFDPQRDDAARLREYADAMRIDLEAGNWYFLRPDGKPRAEAVVAEEFGVKFKRTDPNPDEPGYMFAHLPLILLVNPEGYVERAYTDKQPVWQDVRDDTESVIEAATDA